MKRMLIVLALAAIAVPGAARADTSYGPSSFTEGPRGGDMWNHYRVDPASGSVTVVRVNPVGFTGGLGCGGSGGFANLKIASTLEEPADTVSIAYTDAVLDPYTWINAGLRQGDSYVRSRVVQGPIAGSGVVVIDLGDAVSGPFELWFGIQVASACPNVDGGTARFTEVTFSQSATD